MLEYDSNDALIWFVSEFRPYNKRQYTEEEYFMLYLLGSFTERSCPCFDCRRVSYNPAVMTPVGYMTFCDECVDRKWSKSTKYFYYKLDHIKTRERNMIGTQDIYKIGYKLPKSVIKAFITTMIVLRYNDIPSEIADIILRHILHALIN